jgi:hypothetical protein
VTVSGSTRPLYQLAHRAADVGAQVVPHQNDGTVELLVRGVHEPGVVRLLLGAVGAGAARESLRRAGLDAAPPAGSSV